MTSVKPFKRVYTILNKRETRNTYEPHQWTSTTEHQIMVTLQKSVWKIERKTF